MSKGEILPQDIIIDILSRLPAKFIGQYRCVSKQWCNFLSHPQFIKFHFTLHAHKQETKLIFISDSDDLHTITFNRNPQNIIFDAISTNLNFQNNWLSIACSCNGLVLVENQEHIMYLINPTTLDYHRIPVFHLGLPQQSSYREYGFGYDFASDDYKVVNLSRYRKGNIDTTFVDVYSVRMGIWRRLESLPYDDVLSERGGASGVFVNGVLHWMASKASSFVIIGFDLSDEKFFEVPAPTNLYGNELDWYELRSFRGCLCMFCALLESEIDVWVMKEYRVEESWITFSIDRMDLENGLVPFCPISDDDVVLSVDRDRLTVYNIKEDQWRYMEVDGLTYMFERTGIFIESLVSPMFGKGTEGYHIA
ncbi:F-box/kelch-repeat protein At3g06240-like [Solanum stenotomum]|uniref:F-box/kelch-repeat protein At3g06240-like n=1 Tax=Solanum stenotomum TaxID=172797 RepID=UPI0020D1018A|nr:F-box/kelch-repeat protein At3g06240-like [Solanum stenotomum]